MIDEINLSTGTILLIDMVLAILVPCLWSNLGTYQLDIEPKKEPEGNNTPKLTNPQYGAYIQSQGRYYN